MSGGCLGAFADKPALLFGQGGVEVEHEGIGVGAELSHDERHTLGHQAGDKGDIAREPIELGDALADPGDRTRALQDRSKIKARKSSGVPDRHCRRRRPSIFNVETGW